MGCGHTVQYVVNHPERVISFAMIASGGLSDLLEGQTLVSRKDSNFTPNPDYEGTPWDGSEESMRDLMAGIIYKAEAVWPELITMRNKAALRQKEAQEARSQSLERLHNDPNYRQWASIKERLPKLTIPAIYLYGKQDVLSPVENGYKQEDMLPNIQVFYPDECGHQGQTDQPEMFNQVLLEFFRDGKVSRKTADWAGVSKRRPENPNLVEQGSTVRT
jgi:pimeloyl-ACP methyl ester carboxylesterase